MSEDDYSRLAGLPRSRRSGRGADAAKEPTRTCVGCRERSRRSALVRMVDHDGSLDVDVAGSLPGRGAYLHPVSSCFQAFAGRGGFVRSLRRVIPKVEREALRARFLEVDG